MVGLSLFPLPLTRVLQIITSGILGVARCLDKLGLNSGISGQLEAALEVSHFRMPLSPHDLPTLK